jgi:hypothetical protein
LQISYFPGDYTIGGALQLLKDNNAIHTPVATETWLFRLNAGNLANSTLSLVDATVTEFEVLSINGHSEVRPWKTHKLKAQAPIPVSVIGMHNPNALLRAPQYYKQTAEFIYDANGNLVQTNSLERTTSYINDYSDRYVTASAVNASYTDLAYTSFEADGNGGWNFVSSSVQNSNSLTGLKSYALTGISNISKANLSANTTYNVTYWQKDLGGGSSAVNNQSPATLFERGDGWKLYSIEVTGPSVSISGHDVLIDEVRLYPKGALMSTVAYQEGVGKVAECDANNRLIYYEYDALGRLKVLRDQNKNIIKSYEYNYKH